MLIPTFVIFLREGVEASMIVAILLSYLDQIGQRRHFRDIFIGVGAALVLVPGGGIAAHSLIHQSGARQVQTIFETITFLLAASVLTYMTFWMQKHSRTMRDELQRRSEEALKGRTRWGLGLLAFQAVEREGLETMVFTLAMVFASSAQAPTTAHGHGLLLGAVLGLALALAIAYVIFKLGRRLNLGVFFRVIGIVLMVFAAGLLADAVENMQQLGWLPFVDHVMWNTRRYLSEAVRSATSSTACSGTPTSPTVLQFMVWAVYLIVATTAFILIGRKKQGAEAGSPGPGGRRRHRPGGGDRAGRDASRRPAARGAVPHPQPRPDRRRPAATPSAGARPSGRPPTGQDHHALEGPRRPPDGRLDRRDHRREFRHRQGRGRRPGDGRRPGGHHRPQRERGAAARDDIASASGSDPVELSVFDLADLASVRAGAADLLERCPRIDVLLNNAGLILSERTLSADGYEATFAINHLGPFLLTELLLDRLKASAPSRIVNVASTAHSFARRGWSSTI